MIARLQNLEPVVGSISTTAGNDSTQQGIRKYSTNPDVSKKPPSLAPAGLRRHMAPITNTSAATALKSDSPTRLHLLIPAVFR